MKTHLLKLTPAEFCDQTRACKDGQIFALKHKTMAEVWDNCPKLGWLFWMLEKQTDKPEKQLRLFAVWCARQVQHLMRDKRSLDALDVAERFAYGNATEGELAAARAAARAAEAALAAWDTALADAGEAAWDTALADAGEAAWAAAWAAARATAQATAWDAAWDAQSAQFKKMIANPFR